MRRLTCALCAAALIAGCGSASGGGHTTERTLAATSRGGPNPAAAYRGGPAVVRLSEAEFTITPANPRVTGTHAVDFEVTNHGSVTHSFAVRTPFGVLKSEHIPPGQKGRLTVDLMKPGIYAFYCPLHDHRQRGMRGSVVVQSS
ncbi:MAG: cupredoxin domain-containing protein [Solirubrobacteraceae bacterium]